ALTDGGLYCLCCSGLQQLKEVRRLCIPRSRQEERKNYSNDDSLSHLSLQAVARIIRADTAFRHSSPPTRPPLEGKHCLRRSVMAARGTSELLKLLSFAAARRCPLLVEAARARPRCLLRSGPVRPAARGPAQRPPRSRPS